MVTQLFALGLAINLVGSAGAFIPVSSYELGDETVAGKSPVELAQVSFASVPVYVTSKGWDPTCGAYRAIVESPGGRFTVCYYKEQSVDEMNGGYTLYVYTPNGPWHHFTDGSSIWYTANQPIPL